MRAKRAPQSPVLLCQSGSDPSLTYSQSRYPTNCQILTLFFSFPEGKNVSSKYIGAADDHAGFRERENVS